MRILSHSFRRLYSYVPMQSFVSDLVVWIPERAVALCALVPCIRHIRMVNVLQVTGQETSIQLQHLLFLLFVTVTTLVEQ